MADNPYATPAADLEIRDGEAPALWNPNAAGNWSLLLTPVFGSFLVWRNCHALGHGMGAGLAWFVVSLVMLLPSVVLPFVGLVYLIVWYFASVRPQARGVAARWGRDYPRRGWTVPLLVGFGCWAALVFLFVVVGAALGQAMRAPPG